MDQSLEISLLGGLRVESMGAEISLPASRKTRALLAFLIGTGRPHRRERLCELFWDIPDDPKAALRWALSKLRKVVDTPERVRIIADRERVQFDSTDVAIDVNGFYADLGQRKDDLSVDELVRMAGWFEQVLLDGLDGAGNDKFDAWLIAERLDAQLARVEVLKKLATHPDVAPMVAEKWSRQWHNADPSGAAAHKHQKLWVETIPVVDTNNSLDQSSTDTAAPAETISSMVTSQTKQALRAQQIRFCETRDKTKIAYATLGTGAPILKAANWLNHLEYDWGSPIWGRSFAEIARHRTLIRYDERGCGLSDWEVADLSFDAFVEDLEAVADKLEYDRFPLLGISQGCAVAIEYAVRHPQRVSGLILFGGYAAGWRHHATNDGQALRETVMTLTELGWGTDNPAYRQIFSQTFMPEASKKELDWFNEFQRLTTSPRNAAKFQDAFGHIDVRHRLAQVAVPTIVLHSKHDQRIPIELGHAVAKGIPDAQFVPLESHNHILVDREPAWEVCFDTVGRFLNEKGI